MTFYMQYKIYHNTILHRLLVVCAKKINYTIIFRTYQPYFCVRLSQGNTDQDVFLGQRAGDTRGQQVRHGTRTCDIVRAGQNAGR